MNMTVRSREVRVVGLMVAAVLVLAACGTSVPDIPETGDMQGTSGELQAAAQQCSEGSGKISEQTQAILKAAKAKDLEAAQAAAADLNETAQQISEAAAQGKEASSGLSGLPGGDIASKGMETAFKVCEAVAGYAEDLATKVSAAEGDEATDEIFKASEEMNDKITKAVNELNTAVAGG